MGTMDEQVVQPGMVIYWLLAQGIEILVRDVRCQDGSSTQKYVGHKQEICGLKWSYDDYLLASGGNDNKLFLWSLKN